MTALNPLYRYALILLAAVGLLFGGFAYRSHVYDEGRDVGLAEAAAANTEVRLLQSRADALATENASRSTGAALATLKADHDRVTRDLQAALAASDLRATRLDARVAGLLDEAAGIRPRPPADPSTPGGSPGTPSADPPDASVADLAESVATNYAICLRNSTRLGQLQDWYSSLRAAPQ